MDNTTGSFASFGSNFDPEHEAIASTKHGESSPRLPEMSSSARRNNNNRKYALDGIDEEEPDYTINTSAIERAFPNFSAAESSSSEDKYDIDIDDEPSVEVGRGASTKPTTRRDMDDSRNSFMSIDNSIRSSSPAVKVDYPTPVGKSAVRNSVPRRSMSESLRKDAQVRRASQAQKGNVDPSSSRMNNTRKDQRRSLSDMHAKVRDSYDGSSLGDERPSPAHANTRSTRFGNANLSAQINEAVERAAREVQRGNVKPSNGSRNVTANLPDGTTTHQSFLLPDLPNLSELVSGVYEDGTPVLPRQKQMRSTRFMSPPNDGGDVSRQHLALDGVPVPDDEKALFVSLRVLQERVAELEHAKSEGQRKIEEMRQENAFLKADRPRGKDKYSRSRGYESDEDYRLDSRLLNENQKLEATNLALQNRLDIIDRKAQISESTLNKLTRERDTAVSQLGVAYLETQDYKNENEALKRENAELRSQLARFASTHRTSDDTGRSEQTFATDEGDAEDSQIHTQRSASRNTRDLTSKSTRSRSKPARDGDVRTKVSCQVDKEISRLEKEHAEEALFSIDIPRSGRPPKQKSENRQAERNDTKKSNTGKQRVKRVVVEEVDVTDPESGTEEVSRHTRKSSQGEQDLTLLSLVDERELAQLRKTMEEERRARKQRLANPSKELTANETTRQSNSKTLPRKSSLKESSKPAARSTSFGDLTAASKASPPEAKNSLSVPKGRQRRHSDHAIVASPRRRRRDAEMTSAFILPDITIQHADLAAQDPSKLPESTQRALDSVAQHNGKNCMVCERAISGDGTCNHAGNVTIPKPVPVSERMPEPSIYNEEPTLRPAKSPPVALATVMKALEDELSHLKMQLATYQAAYNKLDASLGKRQRKTLGEKVEKLLKDIDMKADQIYALYDVLEGQKQDGHEMSEQEMEHTLQSIGVDNAPGERTAEVTATTDKSSRKNKKDNAGTETDDEDEDEELPWEGIESTMEVTGRTTGGSRRA